MICQFLVYIEGDLGSLFLYPYLLRGLTLFQKEEKQKGKENISHILFILTLILVQAFIIIYIHVLAF